MKSAYQIEIINRLRKLRKEKGYSQGRLAILLEISEGQMGNIESLRRSHKYTLEHIYKICNEFHVPIEHIFLEDEDYEKEIDIIKLLISKIIRYEQ